MESEKTFLEELISIPADCIKATVRGVDMQLITSREKSRLLAQDSNDEIYHERVLKNGTFIFVVNDRRQLQVLFKVVN